MGNYLDIRQEFWREEFGKALPYHEYLNAGQESHRAKWREMEKHVVTTNEQREMIGQFVRRMDVLCYSGIWCGDCVRQGPMFRALAELSQNIDLRFAERVDDSRLANELRINGALKVPVLVFLSEDYFEVGRFGDRLMTVYRRMARLQIGPSCETGLVPPAQDEVAAEMAEWADIFWRMQIILRLAPMLRERYND